MANEITVIGHEGFPEHFRARLIPGLGQCPDRDGRGEVAVITYGLGEMAVVPSSCVVKGVDLVKRLEVDYDFDYQSWGVRHAFGGPFIFYGAKVACSVHRRRKLES